MARGSMAVETTVFGTGAEILNRPPFKGVSMTIDFTDVTEDEATGEKIWIGCSESAVSACAVPKESSPSAQKNQIGRSFIFV